MLAGGLQGDNPDPDGDVSCNQAALLLLINSNLHMCILYFEVQASMLLDLFAQIIQVSYSDSS